MRTRSPLAGSLYGGGGIGRHPRAIQELQQVIELAPGSPVAQRAATMLRSIGAGLH